MVFFHALGALSASIVTGQLVSSFGVLPLWSVFLWGYILGGAVYLGGLLIGAFFCVNEDD